MNAQKLITRSLDDVAPSVWFFPKTVMAAICEVSESTLDRYRNDLADIKPQKFEWQFYGGGYTRESAHCMFQYAELIKMMRLAIAKQNIKSHMEEFWREYEQKNR